MKKLLVLLLAVCLAVSGASFALAAEQTGNIVVLFTNDIHCAVDDNMSIADLATLRASLTANGDEVILVDAGDAVQGGPIGTLSEGGYIVELMNLAAYDVAIPGNHEFDYGMERFWELVKMSEHPYVSCNFTDLATGKAALPAYQIIEKAGVKVAFVGISTPQTITSSAPKYFQNDKGEWIYSFQQDTTGEALYACVQAAVDAAKAEGADYVIALAHLGIDEASSPWMSSQVIANTTGIDALIDGHSHSVYETEVTNKEGRKVVAAQTGTKLNNVGQLVIKQNGTISAKLVENAEARTRIAEIQKEFDALLNQVVAKTDVDLVVNDPATDTRIVRSAETNLGDLCADAYRAMSGADIAFVNGGGVRAKIAAGDITYGQILNVHPFGNAMCTVEATGQEIIDALEWGSRALPGENGGFLQVSGLTYEIHTYVESSAQKDENGLFSGVTGERRVKNVLVAGEPIDLTKTYILASHNYMLKSKGDGYSMFADNKVLLDEVMLDNQVLINYIVGTLGGVVSADYADPYGQSRIVAVAEKP